MSNSSRPDSGIGTVVKLGGGAMAHPELFGAALDRIVLASRDRRLLVVPGGGPFADAVREMDRRISLSDDTAHWMAVLAMDQSAYLVAEKLEGGALVRSPEEIAAVLTSGRIPVWAPFRWLREADPLPHSWDVTSDSIAAWVAGRVAASRLILIKPPGSTGVDAHFQQALPGGVDWNAIPVDRLHEYLARA